MRPLAAFLHPTGDAMAAAICAPVMNVWFLTVHFILGSLFEAVCGLYVS